MSSPGDPRWSPTAPLENLRARAQALEEIRAFFRKRGVMEVETPVLSGAGATDPNLHSLRSRYTGPGAARGRELYLHTSPEFAMKRLLAAGSGPVYQVCRVFRDGETGRYHNLEFTLLEWYRPGLDYRALMDEVESLVGRVLAPYRAAAPAKRITYREAFRQNAAIDPWTADAEMLGRCAAANGLSVPAGLSGGDHDGWLDLLLTQVVEPAVARHGLCFLYDYPASQAALARVRGGEDGVAERFELYLDGVELANGFQELTDPREQARRFEYDNRRRAHRGQLPVPPDEHLIEALAHGLPPCAGVALGLDRLLMQALGARSIHEVLAFPVDRA